MKESGVEIDRFYYPFENNFPEKTFLIGCREYYPDSEVIAYQHSAWFSNQLGMFLGNGESKFHPIADKIICIDHPWYNKGYIQNEVKKIPKWVILINRKIFLNKSKKFNSFKKVFLDRSTSKFNHCKISNQSSLNNWLKKNSFGIYTPEKLSQEKQIYLFKNASTILGAHGAALTNIIFCKPGTRVVEIIPADHPNKKCERISKILKLRYFRIKTKPDNSDKNFPFKIHLNKRHLKIINDKINL